MVGKVVLNFLSVMYSVKWPLYSKRVPIYRLTQISKSILQWTSSLGLPFLFFSQLIRFSKYLTQIFYVISCLTAVIQEGKMMDTDGFMRLRNEDFPKVHSQSSEMVHCTKPSVFCSDHLKTILFRATS